MLAARHLAGALSACAILATASVLPAQDVQEGPTACTGPESHRFDFWEGSWTVDSRRLGPEGEWIETERSWTAEAVLGGCAFIDFTRGDFGAGAMRGMGSRFYDPDSETWTITWLSTLDPGSLGIWEGRFDADGTTARFLREIPTPEGTVLSRIRWWDIGPDFVEWEHAVSRDGGENWQPTWRMTFRREGAGPSADDDSAGALTTESDLARRLEVLYYAGRLRRGVALADSALDALEVAGSDSGVSRRRVRLLVAKGKLAATEAFTSNRSLDGALGTLREAVSLSEAMPASPERADALLQLGFAEYVQTFLTGGDFAPIRPRFQASLDISRRLDDPGRVARALFHLGLIEERLGEADGAMELYTRSLAVADACGCLLEQSYAQRHVGFVLLGRERGEAALRHLRRSLELREQVGFRVYLPYSNSVLAEVLVELDRPREAEPYAVRAVELAEQLEAPRTRVVALLSLARVRLDLGDDSAGAVLYRRSLELANDIGYEPGIRAASEGLERAAGR